MKTISRLLSLIVVAAAGGVIALALNNYYNRRPHLLPAQASATNPLPVRYVSMSSASAPESASVSFVAAAAKSVPAVVHIQSKVEMEGQPTYNSLWDYFYGNAQRQRIEGMVSGSGVIVSGDGYIVTNNHVVEKAGTIEVTLADRQTYNATVVGKDAATDLALLKIDAKNLPYLEYGNSDDAQVGQWVLAVGNPYNLISTVTAGIISAKGRNIDMLPDNPNANLYPIESYIQTDAAVNPGNSGGALVNTDGQLIGINAAIASPTGSFAGYSFAIPVNLVKKVVADMLKYGAVQRAFLGVSIHNVDADIAKQAGLNSTRGVYVNAVEPNGSAALAGIRQGDVIMKIGDQDVNDVPELEEQVGKCRPGDNITVTVSRNGNNLNIPVVLRNIDGTTAVIKPNAPAVVTKVNELGATFGTVSESEKQKLNIESGVEVTGLTDGKLSHIGVGKGFIVTKIDHHKVNTPDDVKNIIQNKSGGVLLEGVYPNGMKAY
ncbi:MAG: PDZ domain-containing protein, partial [Bacteroidia bacterium]|nr:PDZ domain-containing protein [Bacteroidia bacterium]